MYFKLCEACRITGPRGVLFCEAKQEGVEEKPRPDFVFHPSSLAVRDIDLSATPPYAISLAVRTD